MLLSVIVPVYNAGEYLQPCICSILNLPIEKEVIIVDDGSDDNCVAQLKLESDKVKVLSQSNQGVSAARNAGLAVATGDWIWFVDADDVINVNANFNPDYLESQIARTQGCDANTKTDLLVLPFVWEEKGEAKSFTVQDGEIPYNLWRCWFRRDEIVRQGLRFTVGRKYGEDQEFILNYLLKSNVKTQALDGLIYHYTMRTSGAMMQQGARGKQKKDLLCVLGIFFWNAFRTGNLTKSWVIKQIRRIIKNIIII